MAAVSPPSQRFRIAHHVPRYAKLLYRAAQTPLLVFLALTGNLVMGLAALAFWLVERGRNANVGDFSDALWWAFSTVSTVGYGDIVPVTLEGRIVGAVLIVTGVLFFVSFTATFATVILELTTQEVLERDEALSRRETEVILEEVRALRKDLIKIIENQR